MAGNRGKGNRGGFTLIECVSAMALLLVAVSSAFRTQLVCLEQIRSAEETLAGANDLNAALDRMLLLPTTDLVDPDGEFAPGVPLEAFEGLHLRSERIVPSYPGFVAGAELPDPLEIVLDLTWLDRGGRERSLRLATLKAK